MGIFANTEAIMHKVLLEGLVKSIIIQIFNMIIVVFAFKKYL